MAGQNISFDRAADFYDQTRPLAGPMATIGIQTILDLAGPTAAILEVGVGTGRIGVPLLQRGANLIGCDLSIEMMNKLREKYPAARLTQADAARLPYPSDRFDALITIHVLHLVGAWRPTLRDFKRVLKLNGVYINSWHWHNPDSVEQKVHQYWRDRVEARGVNWRRPGIQDRAELIAELKAMGAQVEELDLAHDTYPITLRQEIDSLANRISSDTWNVPETVLIDSIQATREWTAHEFGDLDRSVNADYRIVLDVARF